MFRMTSGDWEGASLLNSLSCRIACHLGGHSNSSAAVNTLRECPEGHVRFVFWVCYMLDKDMAIRWGQPPCMLSDCCDLTPPPATDPIHDLPIDTRLSIVKEEIFRLLYSPEALKAPYTELLVGIRHLDAKLENWRLSMPLGMRPRLTAPASFASSERSSRNLRAMAMQLEYHYTLTAIHATVRRGGSSLAEGENLPEDLHSVLHSSIDLILEAGRLTLLSMKELIESLDAESFWYVICRPPLGFD